MSILSNVSKCGKNRKLFENSIRWHISKQFLLGLINDLKLLFIILKKKKKKNKSGNFVCETHFLFIQTRVRKWGRVKEWLLETSTYYNIDKKFLAELIKQIRNVYYNYEKRKVKILVVGKVCEWWSRNILKLPGRERYNRFEDGSALWSGTR